MHFCFPKSIFRIFLLIAVLLPMSAPVSAQGSDAGQILARINTLRTQNGLTPLDLNGQLAASAQQHSDDMAATGNVSHTGSDGSSIDSRIRASGYGHWRSLRHLGRKYLRWTTVQCGGRVEFLDHLASASR